MTETGGTLSLQLDATDPTLNPGTVGVDQAQCIP